MATSYTHSIPTPPFSPQNYRMPDENTENPLKSTINLLDSLVAFYQHEQMWVYRTRAVLEDAFPTPPLTDTYSDPDVASAMAEQEYDGYDNLLGVSQGREQTRQPADQPRQASRHSSREQILEMFEKMMEARMESCQRVNKLVREANRATLHLR
ncbi:hypothetical protein CPB84DRAFT_1758195 [Gymnopilus junonius]|uniref:Uncharacterized protein n=1 Tax=Gymnopilus junonius TaxID=109634 RepID=A0A9P5P468_GYMJU|nr:hypothetical protein CPB84DRAFT_1758195 [Gymnopilus junonius]